MTQVTEERRIRLALIDNHALFRESLGRFLAAEPDLEVVGQCADFTEGLALLISQSVDMVLLELKIGTDRADTLLSAARNLSYGGKFFVVTGLTDPGRSAAVLKLGASGIFLKCESGSRLLQAIRLAWRGELWVDQKLIQLLAERYPQFEDESLGSLTEREQTVLKGLLDGLTNKKIGSKVGVSESSIKSTLQQLFEKAGVRTRSQLVRAALEGALAGHADGQSSR